MNSHFPFGLGAVDTSAANAGITAATNQLQDAKAAQVRGELAADDSDAISEYKRAQTAAATSAATSAAAAQSLAYVDSRAQGPANDAANAAATAANSTAPEDRDTASVAAVNATSAAVSALRSAMLAVDAVKAPMPSGGGGGTAPPPVSNMVRCPNGMVVPAGTPCPNGTVVPASTSTAASSSWVPWAVGALAVIGGAAAVYYIKQRKYGGAHENPILKRTHAYGRRGKYKRMP